MLQCEWGEDAEKCRKGSLTVGETASREKMMAV